MTIATYFHLGLDLQKCADVSPSIQGLFIVRTNFLFPEPPTEEATASPVAKQSV